MDHLTSLGYEPLDPQGPQEINDAISKMYTDKVSNIQSNATIKYTYHQHTNLCKGNILCNGTSNIISIGVSYPCNDPAHGPGHMHHNGTARCTVCGTTFEVGDMTSAEDAYMTTNRAHYKVGYTCGKTTSTIEKAEIIFS